MCLILFITNTVWEYQKNMLSNVEGIIASPTARAILYITGLYMGNHAVGTCEENIKTRRVPQRFHTKHSHLCALFHLQEN